MIPLKLNALQVFYFEHVLTENRHPLFLNML